MFWSLCVWAAHLNSPWWDVIFMLIPTQISVWMMINVVAILAYLIIHINIPIFAVCSQIFIRLRLLAADSGLTQRNPLKCQSLVLADYLCRLPLYLPRQNSCWCDVTMVAGCCNTPVKLAQMKCFHIKNTSDSLLLGNINDGKKMILLYWYLWHLNHSLFQNLNQNAKNRGNWTDRRTRIDLKRPEAALTQRQEN